MATPSWAGEVLIGLVPFSGLCGALLTSKISARTAEKNALLAAQAQREINTENLKWQRELATKADEQLRVSRGAAASAAAAAKDARAVNATVNDVGPGEPTHRALVESLVEGQKSQREWNERVEDKVDGQGETLVSLETTAASLKKVTATHTRQLAAYGSNARKAAKAAAASVVTSDAQASAIAVAATEDRHSIAIGK